MADKKPWFKFYPTDWRADQALRLCSPAARGLWVECMCLMHEAQPYGHLLVNAKPVTDAQLAILTGIPQDQLTLLFGELENQGVSSRTRNGVIFSRRMTRDAKRAADGEKYGKQGGNPTLTHKPTLNPHPNPGPSPRGQGQIPEPDIPREEFIARVALGLSPNRVGQTIWTAEQKKAAWQSRICNEALKTMPADDYAEWLDAWAKNDPKAKRLAEQIDKKLKADQRRSA